MWASCFVSQSQTLAVGRQLQLPKSTTLSGLFFLFQDHAEINSTVLRSQTNTARVEGLRSGTVYVVQVRARTVAGFGKYSSKMCFQTLTDGKDGRARREAVVQPPLLFHFACILLLWTLLHDNLKAEFSLLNDQILIQNIKLTGFSSDPYCAREPSRMHRYDWYLMRFFFFQWGWGGV